MSRHSRLLCVLAPGLALSNVAFALTVTVNGSAPSTCAPATDTSCTTNSLVEAITWVNAAGDAAAPGSEANAIAIESATYAPGLDPYDLVDNAEVDLPELRYATTISSDETDLVALAAKFKLRAVRTTADLVLENLVIKAGDVVTVDGSGVPVYTEAWSAVDADYAAVTATNVRVEQGSTEGNIASDRNGVHGFFVREAAFTATDLSAAGFNGNSAVYLQDWWSTEAHDFSITGGTFANNTGDSLDVGGSVWADGSNVGTITGSTFDGSQRRHAYVRAWSLTVTDTTFTGGEGALWFASDGNGFSGDRATLNISGSTFQDSTIYSSPCCGAATAALIIDSNWDGDCNGIDAVIDDTHFLYNESWTYNYNGPSAGDLAWYANSGVLTVTDSDFTAFYGTYSGGSAYLEGGRTRFEDVLWDGTTGGEGYNAYYGGAVYLQHGDMECVRCTFANVAADSDGGALYVDASEATWVSLVDSLFEYTQAGEGGAIYQYGGYLGLQGTQFLSTYAYQEGGALFLRGNHPPSPQQPTANGFEYGLLEGVTLEARNVSTDDTSARSGGVFYAGEGGHTILFEDSLFNDSQAWLPTPAGYGEYIFQGSGGVGFVNPGSTVTIKDSKVTEAYADGYGGAFFSYTEPLQYYQSCGAQGGCGYGPEDPFTCFDPEDPPFEDFQWNEYHGQPFGSAWTLDGVEVSGAYAGEGGSAAAFGRFDDVTVKGSSFVGNETAGRGTILALDADRFTATCNTFSCNFANDGGAAIDLFDDGYPATFVYGEYFPENGNAIAADGGEGGEGVGKDIRYTVENNVIQGNESFSDYAGDVQYDLCDVSWYFSSGEGGGNLARGDVRIHNNTFAASYGAEGHLAGNSGDANLDVRNNIFHNGGDYAWYLYGPSRHVTAEYNLYGGEYASGDVEDDTWNGDYEFPGPTDIADDSATFWNLAGLDCELETYAVLYLEPGPPPETVPSSRGVDEGDPDILDNWGHDLESDPVVFNRSDMGAYGGPHACIPDTDHDTYNVYVDCIDDDRTFFPGAPEVYYDGEDQDCDGADDCDVDDDGHDAVFCDGGDDCNDVDPDTYPGAPDVFDGIDQDCDGNDGDPCDRDGDGHDATNCEGADCNDADANVHPGATDTVGDGIDQDCDGGDGDTCPDVDGDGFDGEACGGNDCNDTNTGAGINPAAEDIPDNGIDEDCSGADRACDVDDDGFNAIGCPDGTDCDDTNASINPGIVEGIENNTAYDGIDQDCHDGDLIDVDCDGFAADTLSPCPEGAVCTDCDDTDPATNPDGSDNPLDDIDQDCEGGPAELWAQGGQGCGCSTPATAPAAGGLGFLGAALAFIRRRRGER